MSFRLKDNSVPSEFKANYVRPTSLNIKKKTVLPNTEYQPSALKQTVVASSTSPGSTFLGTMANLGSNLVNKFKDTDWEDFIIPQSIQNKVPINVRALAGDVLGRDRDITERHLDDDEKEALLEATKNAEKRGSDRIEYKDYGTNSQYGDVGGDNEESTMDLLKRMTDPKYALKTTFGQMAFTKNDDGTYSYQDRYNFNDAKEGGMDAFKQELKDNPDLTTYQKIRKFAKYQGSGPGEGSKVNITL